MLPDRMSMHVAAAGASALDLAFWDDVQGFSYTPVRLASPFITARAGSLQCTGRIIGTHLKPNGIMQRIHAQVC